MLPSTDPVPTAASCPPSRRARGRHLDSLLIAAAVAAQGALLSRGGPPGFGAIALTLAAVAVCVAAWRWRARVPHLDFVVAATAFGGLGMAAATAIGTGMGMETGSHAGHGAGMAHGGAATHGYGGAILGMLIVCVPMCAWRCDPLSGGGFARQAIALLVSTAGMLAGMAAGGSIAGPWLAAALGAAAGMHVAMAAGMAMGTAASLPAVALLDRRRGAPGGPRRVVDGSAAGDAAARDDRDRAAEVAAHAV